LSADGNQNFKPRQLLSLITVLMKANRDTALSLSGYSEGGKVRKHADFRGIGKYSALALASNNHVDTSPSASNKRISGHNSTPIG